jgi:Tfp pilus assembly protein PilF
MSNQIFDQIDAAYYRMRAGEEREKAIDIDRQNADRHRARAALFEKKARVLLGEAAA